MCILLLRVLHRGSGGGGVSEYDVAEMTSSGSGSQFLLRRGGGEDSEDDGRKKGALDARRRGTGDEERREVPACRAWFCHVAYMRTRKKGIEKDTPVRGLHHGSDLHAFRRRGRSDSAALRMYACTQKNVELRHTSIGPWSQSRLGPTVRISMSQPGAGSTSSLSHETTTRGYPCPRC